MTPLFGRPGSYPLPSCKSDACNCGRSDCPTPDKCVSEARWIPCDRVCIAIGAVLACIGVAEVLSRFFGG